MGMINLMEVCGTHTMSIAKAGIKSILPAEIQLLSGPGCPVCVTPAEVIDAVLELSKKEQIFIATYGDMMKVPGSTKGDSLLRRKAEGAAIEMVYSPMDALKLAQDHPQKEVVFLGVGFETTAPGTAACIKAAKQEGVQNFSVLCLLKRIEPALRALISSPDFNVQGFLCPGHVAVILGEKGFRFLTDEYKIPSVIAGFEPTEILLAIKQLLKQIEKKEARLENAYTRAVAPEGNLLAQQMIEDVLYVKTALEGVDASPPAGKHSSFSKYANDIWRGLGVIGGSGYYIRPEYEAYDAAKKFSLQISDSTQPTACRCGDVICGKIAPAGCPLFGTACTPSDPEGPCMVSGEGACAAAYLYGR